jgi:hypothetical protein
MVQLNCQKKMFHYTQIIASSLLFPRPELVHRKTMENIQQQNIHCTLSKRKTNTVEIYTDEKHGNFKLFQIETLIQC